MARGGTSSLAPYRDQEWEIWGMPWISYPRVDRAFEIHGEKFFEEAADNWFKDHGWLQVFLEDTPNTEVWCDKSRMHRFPNPIEFPLEEVSAAVPIPMLENTVCYMVALAIKERRPEIGLWGVHMFVGEEADLARPALLYLLGYAQGIGINVTVAPGSPLFLSNFMEGRYGVRGGPKAIRPKFLCYAGVATNT